MTTAADICSYLGLVDPLQQSTCIGYGQRSPVCRNAVAYSSRCQVTTVLNSLAQSWACGDNVQAQLEKLACMLLCKRNHQWQSSEKVAEWQRSLKNISVQRNSSDTPRCSTSSASSSRAIAQLSSTSRSDILQRRNQVSASLTNEELLSELRRRLLDRGSADLINDILDLAEGIGALFGMELGLAEPGSHRGPRRSQASQAGSNDTARSRKSNTRDSHTGQKGKSAVRPVHDSITPHTQAAPSFTSGAVASPVRPSLENVRQTRLAALSASTSSVRSPSPLRQSHVECIICLESYDIDSDSEHWQCDKCLNRLHMACFDAWCASKQEFEVVPCPHCRAQT